MNESTKKERRKERTNERRLFKFGTASIPLAQMIRVGVGFGVCVGVGVWFWVGLGVRVRDRVRV